MLVNSLMVVFAWTIGLSSGSSNEQKLIQAIFSSDALMPYSAPGNVVDLSIGYSYVSGRFDRETNLLYSSIWEYYSWVDSRLAWNPSQYRGVKVIRLSAKTIWTPDIRLYNALSRQDRDDVLVVITSEGRATWVPPAFITTQCSSVDQQVFECNLKFGSWTSDDSTLKLVRGSKGFNLDAFVPSRDYTLIDSSSNITAVRYECCPEPYSSFNAQLKIRLRNRLQ